METVGTISQVAVEFAQEMEKRNKRTKIINAMPVIILFIIFTGMSVVAQGFLTLNNIHTILNQLSILLVMTMGLTFVILIGGIDLSGEGVAGFVGALTSLLVLNGSNTNDFGMAGVVLAIVAATVIGCISGVIHVKGKMPSFIVTYAVSSIMSGVAVLSYKGQPAMIKYSVFTKLDQGDFLGIPYLTWIAFIIFTIAYILQTRTKIGTYAYAIGDNETIVRNTGININRVKIAIFAWSGFCIGIAGAMGAVRVGRGIVDIGLNLVFPTITAVVVGGTALTGGKGGVVNSLIGALIVTIINNGLILLGVSTYIQAAVQGIIIIIAVSLSVEHGRKEICK
jgi:ribose transport system permease protein